MAKTLHLHESPAAVIVLGLVVWLLYITDHVLDACRANVNEKPARKRFFRQHRVKTRVLAIVGAVVTAALAFCSLPAAVLHAGITFGLEVAGYFAFVHLAPTEWRVKWPRELVVAVLFSPGTFLPLYAENTGKWMVFVAPCCCLIALCAMNCCAIECWECYDAEQVPSVSAHWITRHFGSIAVAAALAAIFVLPRAISLAVALSACGLLTLNGVRQRWRADAVRVLADAVMCTPALFLLFPWLG